MTETLLAREWWPGVMLWGALYIADYYWTLAAARLYRQGAHEHIVFEGSYELTPMFQKDINSLRRVSPRFVLMLVLSSALILLEFELTRLLPRLRFFYDILLGALVLAQCMVHLRHIRNFYLFRLLRRPADGSVAPAGGAVEGQLRYRREVTLMASAMEGLSFAGVYLLLATLLKSWFFLGGALAALGLWRKHRALARRYVAQRDRDAQRP